MDDHENPDSAESSAGPTETMPAPSGDSGVPKEQRTMGMLCHLISLSGYVIPFGNIIGPLVIWLIKKDEMPFVNDQGKESLNFQITITIVTFALIVFSIIPFVICLTLPILIAIMVVDLVFVIIATLKANEGEAYRYPMTIRMIS